MPNSKARLNPKSLKEFSKGCGCAVPEDETGWSCMKGCLVEWGVPSSVVLGCAIACASNLYACIACLGTAEYIVAGCTMYCVYYLAKTAEPAAPLTPKLGAAQTRSTHAAKLSLRAARSGSSR